MLFLSHGVQFVLALTLFGKFILSLLHKPRFKLVRKGVIWSGLLFCFVDKICGDSNSQSYALPPETWWGLKGSRGSFHSWESGFIERETQLLERGMVMGWGRVAEEAFQSHLLSSSPEKPGINPHKTWLVRVALSCTLWIFSFNLVCLTKCGIRYHKSCLTLTNSASGVAWFRLWDLG